MADTLELTNKIERFIVIPVSAPVTDVLSKLDGVSFALIGSISKPQGLAQAKHLSALAGEGDQPLAEVLAQLPPLVVITGEAVALLDTVALSKVALILKRKEVPGILVYHNHQATGVLSRKTIAAALSPSAIISPKERGDVYGKTITQARCYICQQCKEEGQAQYIFSPDQGNDTMNCPFDPLHGRMELYEQ